MTAFDLRPLSLGEILDRTFTLYRRNFLLFMGISAIPQVFVLAINLVPLIFAGSTAATTWFPIVFVLGIVVLTLLAYLFSQGGTILAVTELYLGRTTSILQSLGQVRGELGTLFGVVTLNGLAIMGATLALIIPGIYVFCRLLVCVPAALVEKHGPRDSLSRSWNLTRSSAGRAFVIILLYFAVLMAADMLLVVPFSAVAGAMGTGNPEMARMLLVAAQVGNSIAAVLVSPILLIATAVFYFDLRVRKEAFDLQIMMNPDSERISGSSSSGMPSILS